MSVHWDRPWDSQGDEEREWSRELEERFEAGEQPATEGDCSAAAGDAEDSRAAPRRCDCLIQRRDSAFD